MEKLTQEQESLMFAHFRKIISEHTAGRPQPPAPAWYIAALASSSEKPEKPYYTAADARQGREAPGADDLIFPEDWER